MILRNLAHASMEMDMSRLHSDIFAQHRYMLNGVDVKVKLVPSKDSFNLVAHDGSIVYKFIITHATLIVRKTKLNPDISLAHEKA
jgi:hypothetical protein